MDYHMISRTGGRDHNEDSVGAKICGRHVCFALADGLGGHGKGEVASKLAVDTVLKLFETWESKDGGGEFLEQGFENCQRSIRERQQEEHAWGEMKTTLVVLSIVEGMIRWGHIGDSRLYYFYRNRLRERTKDHSVPQMLVAAGQLKEKQIRFHEDRNRLLRVLGVEWNRPCYELSAPVKAGGRQAFLLCSDGFWELIDEKQMTRCLKRSASAREWVLGMEKEILENGSAGSMDNYSAIGVLLNE